MKPASSPLGARSVGDRRAVPLHTGLVDPRGAGERPLTPTSPPSMSSTEAEPRRRPGPLSPRSRQGARFPRSRVPSIDMCSPNPAFAGGLFGLGARHRSRRFATDDPASDALSLPAALSRGEARPIVVIHVLFARGREGPRAACRLLQSLRSASTTTAVRTPQYRTRSRPLVQLRSRRSPFGVAELRMAMRPFGSRGQPRGHGPGASIRGRLASRRGISHRDRSR